MHLLQDRCPKPGTRIYNASNANADTDGTPDCMDGCPLNKEKVQPGKCGCDRMKTKTANDGTISCNNQCPGYKNKISPELCSCVVSDDDSDTDGTPDHNDK